MKRFQLKSKYRKRFSRFRTQIFKVSRRFSDYKAFQRTHSRDHAMRQTDSTAPNMQGHKDTVFGYKCDISKSPSVNRGGGVLHLRLFRTFFLKNRFLSDYVVPACPKYISGKLRHFFKKNFNFFFIPHFLKIFCPTAYSKVRTNRDF